MKKTFKKILLSMCILGTAFGIAHARDQVQIAGSSTVLPYAKIVAEEFGKTYYQFKSPVVESGGSSAGLKEFCRGIGPNTIDIANASRQIKDSEVEACRASGVTDILEVRFGYDGIVFATNSNKPKFELKPEYIFMALNDKNTVAPRSWNQIDPTLPDQEIIVFIPGEKHGTREVFEEKVMLEGCKQSGVYDLFLSRGLDKKAAEQSCMQVRKDSRAIDIDGDYTETLARLESNPDGMGVFGLSFYENNTDKLNVATMNGIEPSVETISSGEYPVSRPLFFYVKKAHIGVISGLKEYVEFFASDKMIGPDGPLAEYGLVPLPENEFNELQNAIK